MAQWWIPNRTSTATGPVKEDEVDQIIFTRRLDAPRDHRRQRRQRVVARGNYESRTWARALPQTPRINRNPPRATNFGQLASVPHALPCTPTDQLPVRSTPRGAGVPWWPGRRKSPSGSCYRTILRLVMKALSGSSFPTTATTTTTTISLALILHVVAGAGVRAGARGGRQS